MIDEVYTEANTKMHSAVEALKKDLAAVRTGRANAGILEHVQIDYYGTIMPLNQIAGISIPEARLIVIQPWDKHALTAIEKAILKSNLGLTPSSDGNVIRLTIPQLTEDRRKELVKMVNARVEDCRIEIRNIRRETIETLRALEKERELSEDDRKRASDQIQKITDGFVAEAGKLGDDKDTELMHI